MHASRFRAVAAKREQEGTLEVEHAYPVVASLGQIELAVMDVHELGLDGLPWSAPILAERFLPAIVLIVDLDFAGCIVGDEHPARRIHSDAFWLLQMFVAVALTAEL